MVQERNADRELAKPLTIADRQKRTKAYRRGRHQSADQEAARALRQFAERYKSDLGDRPLEVIKKSTWEVCRTIMAEPSGKAAQRWLQWCPNPLFAGSVRMMALIPRDDGSNHFAWGDYRARAAVALGALLWGQRKPSNRDDHWSSLMEGITRQNICAVLQDPHTGRVPSMGFLTGVYGYGGRWSHTPVGPKCKTGPGCGIITALEQVGAIYRDLWQEQGFATEDGHQPNQYFLTCWIPEAHPLAERGVERLAVLMHELDLQARDEQSTPVPGRWQDRAPP